MKPTLMVSFSGGRTSAYMARHLQLNYSDKYNLVFVFMNTGQEHEETLRFVNECDTRWNLGVVWLEAVFTAEKGKGTSYRVVTFETAHRGPDLFMSMCRKYGVPNAGFKHCNRELKLQPFEKYRADFHPGSARAIGIRVDEIDRMAANADKAQIVYPLVSWFPATKPQILRWWDEQDFNLMIPEHHGNCVTCWKKSDRKLFTNWRTNPEWFECFDSIETDELVKEANAEKNSGVFFRNHRSTADIIATASESYDSFSDPYFKHIEDKANGCSDHCEVWSDGQLDMLGYDSI